MDQPCHFPTQTVHWLATSLGVKTKVCVIVCMAPQEWAYLPHWASLPTPQAGAMPASWLLSTHRATPAPEASHLLHFWNIKRPKNPHDSPPWVLSELFTSQRCLHWWRHNWSHPNTSHASFLLFLLILIVNPGIFLVCFGFCLFPLLECNIHQNEDLVF